MSMTPFEEKYLNLAKEIVLANIPKDEYAVFLFGSRANGKSNVNSDFDIGILGTEKISNLILWKIEELIEDSDIPHKVDIVDFKNVSDNFKSIALKNILVWNTPKNFTHNFATYQKH